VAVTALTALSAGALFTGVAVAGPIPSPSDAPAPGELQTFYDQQLSWGSCASFAVAPEDRLTFTDPKFDCAYLSVPLDYADPSGRTAQIGVIRQKALDRDQRIGSLVTNPGGPGGSGMGTLPLIAAGIGGGEVAHRFDLVGFDPRGIGASKPGIQCLTPAEFDAARAAPADTSTAGIEAVNKAFATKCGERTGLDVLANLGTRDVARDMDVLRSALGEDKLSYLGYSYGTRLGTLYAEAFPSHVRALVLDGAVNPEQSAAEVSAGQTTGFEQAFAAFAADCAEHTDCPLGTDPAQADAKYTALVDPLTAKPLPTTDGRTLSSGDAQIGTLAALYSPKSWPVLRQALTELAAGDATTFMLIADQYYGRTPDGTYGQLMDGLSAVRCVDNPTPADSGQTQGSSFGQAQGTGSGQTQGSEAEGTDTARDVCAFWPVSATSEPHRPDVDGLPQVLVVSTTGDPATPYESGVVLAEDLGARLLTAEGTQHGAVFQGTKCVDDAATRYLVDLELPDDGTRCRIG
jgi:pimeloyl-ACP methyl ester carboxylesterase